MKILGIIPARGGSKGVPRKNIKPLAGKPLIQYTIEAALESDMLNTVVVSSDDEEILEFSKKFNGVHLHKRDTNIAQDTSLITETIDELLKIYQCDIFLILQPTSPIRVSVNINEAIQILIDREDVNSVISVVEMNDVHPARMYWKVEEELKPILPDFEKARRQDIPLAYYRNGSIYAIRTSAYLKEKSTMIKPIMPYIMPYNWLLNIDEPRDIIIGEALIKAWEKNQL